MRSTRVAYNARYYALRGTGIASSYAWYWQSKWQTLPPPHTHKKKRGARYWHSVWSSYLVEHDCVVPYHMFKGPGSTIRYVSTGHRVGIA
eukprot:2891211-Rhodomonas_salina.1